MLARRAGEEAGGPAIFSPVTWPSTPEAVPRCIRDWTVCRSQDRTKI